MTHQLLLFLHLAGAIVWLGGMVFAHFCLRPAATGLLQPPQRLPLMTAALGRFFAWVAAAVVLILASGLAMMLQVGFAHAPVGWHMMAALGVVMAVVFGVVALGLYPTLRRHCAAAAWPAGAAVLQRIRQLVVLNLVLGVCVVAAAVSAR